MLYVLQLKLAHLRFTQHRRNAKKRRIPFNFTFEGWWRVWQESSRWSECGNRRDQYCMARHNDVGPYAANNVSIITQAQNRNGVTPFLGHKHSDETRKRIGRSLLGRECSAATRKLISQRLMGNKNPSGNKLTDVHKKLISQRMRGNKHWMHRKRSR
jgi:hypothetical protein